MNLTNYGRNLVIIRRYVIVYYYWFPEKLFEVKLFVDLKHHILKLELNISVCS